MKQKTLLIAIVSAFIFLSASPVLAQPCATNWEARGRTSWQISQIMARMRAYQEFNKWQIVKQPVQIIKPEKPAPAPVPVVPLTVGEISAGQVIAETNLQRQKAGLAPLSANEKLNQAALAKAQDMLQKQYFDHVSPDGTGLRELIVKVGYDYRSVGENLAYGNFKDANSIVQGWMNSPGHRANILSSGFKEIGVAVVKGTYQGRTVWMAVQEFGSQR